MSNPMMYIKNLEAAGFERNQAEAQVQMVLDVLEGGLATKADFVRLESNLTSGLVSAKADLAIFKEQVDNRFSRVEGQMREME